MVDAAACLVWLLWAFSMYILVADIAAHARGRVHRPRLRLAVPLHAAATSLVGSATLAVTSIAGRPTMVGSVAATPAPPVPAGATPTSAAPMPTSLTTARTATGPAVMAGQVTLLVADQHYTYTVRRGDNLSHIAADWLGDPDRWPEIYHLNRGRHFPSQALSGPRHQRGPTRSPPRLRSAARENPRPSVVLPRPPRAGSGHRCCFPRRPHFDQLAAAAAARGP